MSFHAMKLLPAATWILSTHTSFSNRCSSAGHPAQLKKRQEVYCAISPVVASPTGGYKLVGSLLHLASNIKPKQESKASSSAQGTGLCVMCPHSRNRVGVKEMIGISGYRDDRQVNNFNTHFMIQYLNVQTSINFSPTLQLQGKYQTFRKHT